LILYLGCWPLDTSGYHFWIPAFEYLFLNTKSGYQSLNFGYWTLDKKKQQKEAKIISRKRRIYWVITRF